jgi:Tfp pilus assembly protein PilV
VKHPRRRRRFKGHSLLEAMLAGSILLMGLGGVVSALGSGQAVNTHTHAVSTAVLVGERAMERLLLLPTGHSELSTTISHTGATYGSHAQLDATGIYTPTWNVSAGPIDGTLRIDVTVSWPERSGTKSLTLTTYR